jgi:transposase
VTASETIAALTAALAAEREARRRAEARASGAEALVAYYKLQITKLRRERYGQSSQRWRKLLDQLERQLEEAAAPRPRLRSQLRRAGRQHDGEPVHPQEAGAGTPPGAPATRAETVRCAGLTLASLACPTRAGPKASIVPSRVKGALQMRFP